MADVLLPAPHVATTVLPPTCCLVASHSNGCFVAYHLKAVFGRILLSLFVFALGAVLPKVPFDVVFCSLCLVLALGVG